MARFNFLFYVIGITLFLTGCSGEGLRAKIEEEVRDTIAGELGDTAVPAIPGDGVGADGSNGDGDSDNDTTTPQPSVLQPGDIVQDSPRDPRAEYPEVGAPAPEVQIPAEPNSDRYPPVISIIEKPEPIIANDKAEVEVWVADNVNGRGIKKTECKLNDNSFTECETSYKLEDLPDGTHTVVSRTTDGDDNVSGEVSYTFMVDTVPPEVELTKTPEPLTGENSALIEFVGDDATSGVEEFKCSLNGSNFEVCSGPQKIENLPNGDHRFQVISVDKAGHESPVAVIEWEVDTSIPTVRIAKAPDVYTSDSVAQFEFIGNVPGGSLDHYECQVDGGDFQVCSTPLELANLAEGSHQFAVRAHSEVGRVSSVARHQWTVDTLPPAVRFAQTPSDPTGEAKSQFQFAGTDNGSGLDFMECRINGGAASRCSSPQALTLADGNYTYEVRGIDKVGNISNWISYSWLVDQTAPVVQITKAPESLNSSSSAEIQFTVNESGSGVEKVECAINGGGYSECSSPLVYNNLPEGDHKFAVRAIDKVGNVSATQEAWWVIDQSGPTITFVQSPSDIVIIGENADIQFIATDDSGVEKVQCQINGEVRSCDNNTLFTDISEEEKDVTLVVTTEDVLGNISVAEIQWSVQHNYQQERTLATVSPDRPVDVLFVVDNSKSMDDERANLAQRIDGFIEKIDGLDWQISVISTDVVNNRNAKGNFVELIGMPGEYILDSSMNIQQAQNVFGNTVQGFGNGSADEMGIYATKLSIDRYLAGQQEHTDFYRDGADLSVIVLSDEDENSDGTDLEISPREMVSYVKDSLGATKNFTWHSMVTKSGDADCLAAQSFAREGRTYEELSKLTGFGQVGGAIIGSVCESDYTGQLADIGQSVKDRQNAIALDCDPADQNKDGQPDIVITYTPAGKTSAQPFTKSYTLQGQSLVFGDLLQPGNYNVDYSCIK